MLENSMKRVGKKKVYFLIGVLLAFGLFYLYYRTGTFNRKSINDKDLKYWNFTSDGLIVGAEEFEIKGSNENCWLLIHSYCSTPAEMKEIGHRINAKYNDSVYALRLLGHSTLPGDILNLSLDNWYNQVEKEYDKISLKCGGVNVLGSSFGGTLALRLGEEKDVGRLYLVNAFLKPTHKWYYGLSGEIYLKVFSDIFVFSKKKKIARINSKEGLNKHITWWSFPLQPVKNSFEFIEITYQKSGGLSIPVLILHSEEDGVADFNTINELYEKLDNEKKIVVFKDSDHILLMDYDKEETMDEIINFEENYR